MCEINSSVPSELGGPVEALICFQLAWHVRILKLMVSNNYVG